MIDNESLNKKTDIQPPQAKPTDPQPEQPIENQYHLPPSNVVHPEAGRRPARKKLKKVFLAIVGVLLAALVVFGVYALLTSTNTGEGEVTKVEIEKLRVGSAEGPASVFFPDEGLLGVQIVLDRQVYEGLVGYDQAKITPLLAESWTNPDQNTWVFNIKPNVKFHTGKDVKAEEVKAALDDLKQYDYWSIFVSTIDSIEVTGELELTIKTTEPDALLLNRLSQAYISDISAPDKLGANGTGAYYLDDTAENNESSTTLAAFDGYHGERAMTRSLVFTIYSTDEEMAEAVKEGELDIAQTVPIPAIEQILEGSDLTSKTYSIPGVFGLYMNQIRTENTILKNKDIRLAIAQAIDRQTLIDTIDNKNTPSYQVIPASLPGHDTSIRFPNFDIDAAKATLARAGYDNTPLEFSYVKDIQLDAPILIEQLKAVGFNIQEKMYEADDISTALADLRDGKFDLFGAGFSSDVFDARDVLGGLLGSTESTYPVYNNPAYDQLLMDSDREFDPVKRIQLLQQANRHILEDIAFVPIRNSTYIAYFAKDIDIATDFNGGGSIGAYYRKVGRIVE